MAVNKGKMNWVVPDGYIPLVHAQMEEGPTGYISHECICLLNITEKDARIKLTIYYEDREPEIIENIIVKSQRSNHLRLDELKKKGKEIIPRGCPYSLLIQSDTPVIAQMSRLDTTQNNMAFLSTMCYPLD